MTRKLRAVPDDEPVKKPVRKPPSGSKKKAAEKPVTIRQAADSSERELLVALRSHLAGEMDKGAVPAHALASVSAKIREYDREIRSIDARESEEGGRSGDVPDAKFDSSAI